MSSSWLCSLGLVYNRSFIHSLSEVGFVSSNEESSSVDELSPPSCAFPLKDPCLGITLGSYQIIYLVTVSFTQVLSSFFFESYDSLMFAPNFRWYPGILGCN